MEGESSNSGAGQQCFGLDETAMRMFQAFSLLMEKQQEGKKKGVLATKALQSVINKLDQFNGRDISKYLRYYTREMEVSKVSHEEMIENFEIAVVPEIRERVRELRSIPNTTWESFVRSLKDE